MCFLLQRKVQDENLDTKLYLRVQALRDSVCVCVGGFFLLYFQRMNVAAHICEQELSVSVRSHRMRYTVSFCMCL